jgi:hypothetical protein
MADNSPQEVMRRSTEESRKADEQHRKAVGVEAKKGTEAARKSSMEVLKEQASMRPEPSQEEADQIKVGARDPLESEEGQKQPSDGPATRAAGGEPDAVFRPQVPGGPANYNTRDTAKK